MICCHDYLTSMKWGYLGEVNIYIYIYIYTYVSPILLYVMEVSWKGDTSNSSILIGFSIMNHPLWDVHIFGGHHV